MENGTKNILLLSAAAIAGGYGGSWATARLGAALGLSLGPWGSAAGAMAGAMLGTSLAKNVFGIENPSLPDPDAIAAEISDSVSEAVKS